MIPRYLAIALALLVFDCTTDSMKTRWHLQDQYRANCEKFDADYGVTSRTDDEVGMDFSDLRQKRCAENSKYCDPPIPKKPTQLTELESTMGWTEAPRGCGRAADGSYNWP